MRANSVSAAEVSIDWTHLESKNLYEVIQSLSGAVSTDLVQSLTGVAESVCILQDAAASKAATSLDSRHVEKMLDITQELEPCIAQLHHDWPNLDTHTNAVHEVLRRVMTGIRLLTAYFSEIHRVTLEFTNDIREKHSEQVLRLTTQTGKSLRLLQSYASLCDELMTNIQAMNATQKIEPND